MLKFDNDEEGYRAWLAANPTGYFLNCYRNSRPAWRLHRATCYTFSGRDNLTTGQYYKVCSTQIEELTNWAEQGSDPDYGACKSCNPFAS
jgi:hypothetical protein